MKNSVFPKTLLIILIIILSVTILTLIYKYYKSIIIEKHDITDISGVTDEKLSIGISLFENLAKWIVGDTGNSSESGSESGTSSGSSDDTSDDTSDRIKNGDKIQLSQIIDNDNYYLHMSPERYCKDGNGIHVIDLKTHTGNNLSGIENSYFNIHKLTGTSGGPYNKLNDNSVIEDGDFVVFVSEKNQKTLGGCQFYSKNGKINVIDYDDNINNLGKVTDGSNNNNLIIFNSSWKSLSNNNSDFFNIEGNKITENNVIKYDNNKNPCKKDNDISGNFNVSYLDPRGPPHYFLGNYKTSDYITGYIWKVEYDSDRNLLLKLVNSGDNNSDCKISGSLENIYMSTEIKTDDGNKRVLVNANKPDTTNGNFSNFHWKITKVTNSS